MSKYVKKPLVETECSVCGAKFTPTSPYITTCEECKKFVKGYRALRDGYGVTYSDFKVKERAIERAKKNDRIIGEGYAERQIAESLRLAGKINTEL